MKYVKFQERQMAFEIQGKPAPMTNSGRGKPGGPAIVLLHGFCEDSSVWNDLITELVGARFRVVCIDLPGFGQSEAPGQASIEYYAEAVHAVLSQLKLEKVILIGHSMGGYTALAFAEKYPGMLLGLGMFHSHPYADSEEKKEARCRSIQFVKDQGHVVFVKQLIPGLFAPAFAKSQSFTLSRLIHAASTYPAAGIIGGLEAMIARPARSALLASALYPVLFIIGEEDQAIPADQRLSQTLLPCVASVHVLERVGHMGMLEAPKRTQQAVREFAQFCIAQTKPG